MGSKDNILRCALTLFSSRGYESVSVQELVSMAGVTKPTLYYYFGSKEGVYEHLTKSNYEALDKMVKTAVAYTPNPKSYYDDIFPTLKRLTLGYFKFAIEHEQFYRMALINLFQPGSSDTYRIVNAYHFKQYDIISDMFFRVSAVHGNIKGKEWTLAWTFLGMINSFIGLHFNKNANTELDDNTASSLVKQFMHGIFS